MLDHVSLGVSDIDRSRRFYDAALRPLGLVRIVDFGAGRGSDYGAAPGSLGVQFRRPRSPPAGATTARRGCGRSITPITTGLSCSTPMAIASRRYATRRRARW